jgi:homoserine kinase type II
MAVYTQVGAEQASEFLERFDVGRLTAMKGIAEGVENSNYLIETTQSRFILTLYEQRVDPADLPYFHALLAHLHRHGSPVPRFIEDRNGAWLHELAGKNACLIEFLSGISVSKPTPTCAENVGRALGRMHASLADFGIERPNPLGQPAWRPLFEKCDPDETARAFPGLSEIIARECDFLDANWPTDLPRSAIHADLFPDNVLTVEDQVTGLIDFYFACTDFRMYDVAVTHSAWAFDADGAQFHQATGDALLKGYSQILSPTDAEKAALPILARGAAMRFLLTRLYDWINTPANALVTRKDPLAFARRLGHYATNPVSMW